MEIKLEKESIYLFFKNPFALKCNDSFDHCAEFICTKKNRPQGEKRMHFSFLSSYLLSLLRKLRSTEDKYNIGS